MYQPVVDLQERRSIGFEALTRLTTGAFTGPTRLFKAAYENDAIWKLERLCRERAIRGVQGFPAGQLLFLNMEPDSIYDPALRSERIFEQLREVGLSPERVVLEIAEHSAVQDHQAFRQMLSYFQFHGFRLAVDDVGSGYSGLQSIAELRPHFIKDRHGADPGYPSSRDQEGSDRHHRPILVELGDDSHRRGRRERSTSSGAFRASASGLLWGYLFAKPGPPFPQPDLAVIG